MNPNSRFRPCPGWKRPDKNVLDHVKAILVLKVALVSHAWSPRKTVSLFVFVIMAVVCVLAALAIAAGLFMLGKFLGEESPRLVMLVIDALVAFVVMFWLFSLVFEVQRSDIVDFRRFMYLPISLKLVFLLNFLGSLFSPPAVLFILPAFGLSLGLAFSFGPQMLLTFPLACAFFLMLAAWVYYFQGLLAILMANKRRRRLVLTFLPLILVLLSQVPALTQFFIPREGSHTHKTQSAAIEGPAGEPVEAEQRASKAKEKGMFAALRTVNTVIPLGWFPLGVYALATGSAGAAAVCFMGLLGFCGLGLGLGYRSTRKYYLGVQRPSRAHRRVEKRRRLPERRRNRVAGAVPFLDDDTAAATLAALASYARHPQVRVAVIMSTLVAVGALFFLFQGSPLDSESGPAARTSPLLAVVAPVLSARLPALMILLPMFMFMMYLFNVFGIDGEGFRALVLLPTPRRKYILARNVALFVFVGGLGLFLIVMTALLLGTGIASLLMAILQLVATYLLFCVAGNVASLYFPFPIRMDIMRAPANRWSLAFIGFVYLLLLPVLAAPLIVCLTLDALLPAPGLPLGLVASVVWLLMVICLYVFSLGPTGVLLLEREQRMLDMLIRERD